MLHRHKTIIFTDKGRMTRVSEVVSLEVLRRCLSEVRSVKLLGSDKSGHSKRSDRPTVKNTDHGG